MTKKINFKITIEETAERYRKTDSRRSQSDGQDLGNWYG